MTDYETLKKMLGKSFHNPIETETDPEEIEYWKQDWNTEYLLTDGDILFFFDKEGKYKDFTTSW